MLLFLRVRRFKLNTEIVQYAGQSEEAKSAKIGDKFTFLLLDSLQVLDFKVSFFFLYKCSLPLISQYKKKDPEDEAFWEVLLNLVYSCASAHLLSEETLQQVIPEVISLMHVEENKGLSAMHKRLMDRTISTVYLFVQMMSSS